MFEFLVSNSTCHILPKGTSSGQNNPSMLHEIGNRSSIETICDDDSKSPDVVGGLDLLLQRLRTKRLAFSLSSLSHFQFRRVSSSNGPLDFSAVVLGQVLGSEPASVASGAHENHIVDLRSSHVDRLTKAGKPVRRQDGFHSWMDHPSAKGVMFVVVHYGCRRMPMLSKRPVSCFCCQLHELIIISSQCCPKRHRTSIRASRHIRLMRYAVSPLQDCVLF